MYSTTCRRSADAPLESSGGSVPTIPSGAIRPFVIVAVSAATIGSAVIGVARLAVKLAGRWGRSVQSSILVVGLALACAQ